MLVYIAGNPRVSMNEIKALREELEKSGHCVTSRWIDEYGHETTKVARMLGCCDIQEKYQKQLANQKRLRYTASTGPR